MGQIPDNSILMQFGQGHGFLQDGEGNFSIMRLVFLWLILNATFMAWYILIDSVENVAEAATIFGTVTGVAVTLKTIQNQQEKQPKEKP
jgi:hypothetical protein